MNHLHNTIIQNTDHIRRVGELLNFHISKLISRAINHDKSKFNIEELEPLVKMSKVMHEEGQVDFNSPEYKERMKTLKPMLDHHYQNNRHHPEHHAKGIEDMNLLDITEMLADWIAASERHGSELNIQSQVNRFNINPQLAQILKNSVEDFKQ